MEEFMPQKKSSFYLGLAPILLLLPSCSSPSQPDKVKVQAIMISFRDARVFERPKGAALNAIIDARDEQGAKKLAADLYERILKGADFETLMRRYSDEPRKKTWKIANGNQWTEAGYYPRSGFTERFADKCFELKKGEVGIVDYHWVYNPCGILIVKRLE